MWTLTHRGQHTQSAGADLEAPPPPQRCADFIPGGWMVRTRGELGGRVHGRNGGEKVFRVMLFTVSKEVFQYFNSQGGHTNTYLLHNNSEYS